MIVTETERLKISEFSTADASFFLELVNCPNWIKYISDINTKTIQDAEKRIIEGYLKSYKEYGFGFCKLLLKEENDKAIGTCGLIKRDELEDVDLGFAFLPEHEGKGFGFESSEAIMELAKSKLNIKKLVAITVPFNTKAIKLLEKLGFVFEKKVKAFEGEEELQLFAKTL